MNEYLVEVKVKNNYLYHLMMENGIKALSDLAEKVGISYHSVYLIANLKAPLFNSRMEIRPSIQKLADFFGVIVDDIVPKDHWFEPLKKNNASIEMSRSDFEQLLLPREQDPEELLKIEARNDFNVDEFLESLGLTYREMDCLRYRFFDELARDRDWETHQR